MKLLLTAAFLCIVLSGCGSDNPQPGPAKTPHESRSQDVSGIQMSSTPSASAIDIASPLRLTFQASDLVSGRDAVVNLSGCSGKIKYSWAVNNTPVTLPGEPRLAAKYFKRDDEVTVNVSCGKEHGSLTGRVLNGPPEVIKINLKDPIITAGRDIDVDPEAIDPDGDDVDFDYHWFVNGEEVASDHLLPGKFVKTGQQIDLTVVPRDLFASGPEYSGKDFVVPNSPPHFVTTPPSSFRVEKFSYQAQAVDPDGDEIIYRIDEGPPGVYVNEKTGLVTWDIPKSSGSYRIRIVAEDPTGQYSAQEFSFNLQFSE